MAILQHKRGTPFSKLGQWQNALNQPIEMGVGKCTVRSSIRTQDGRLIADCVVSYPTVNTFKLRVADTLNFPVERLLCDIRFSIPNQDDEPSDTFFIDVQQMVTESSVL